jgi:hypothetical protein
LCFVKNLIDMWGPIQKGVESKNEKALKAASDRIRLILNKGMEYQKVIDEKVSKK